MAIEVNTTNPSLLDKYNEIKEMSEKRNMDKKKLNVKMQLKKLISLWAIAEEF